MYFIPADRKKQESELRMCFYSSCHDNRHSILSRRPIIASHSITIPNSSVVRFSAFTGSQRVFVSDTTRSGQSLLLHQYLRRIFSKASSRYIDPQRRPEMDTTSISLHLSMDTHRPEANRPRSPSDSGHAPWVDTPQVGQET